MICDKVWRCRGRIQNANVSFSTKYPILLLHTHFLTTLLVQRAHGRVMHGGVKSTLTELRSQVWIVRGRNFVRRILGESVLPARSLKGSRTEPPYRLHCPHSELRSHLPLHTQESILLDHCTSRRSMVLQGKSGYAYSPVA